MNLRQNTGSGETTTGERAWYHQPETTQPVPVPIPIPVPAPAPTLFEPSAAERILARAGALQEVHGQMLSREQIEAVAHEIGIQPEFVRLAIEQEAQGKNGVAAEAATVLAPRPRSLAGLRVVTTMIACAAVAAAYTGLNIQSAQGPISGTEVVIVACVFPLLLSLMVGIRGRSRRWGAVSGLAIALTAIAICIYPNENRTIDTEVLRIFAGAIASSTLIGVAGAQVRRVVSRRQVSGRSHRDESRKAGAREED